MRKTKRQLLALLLAFAVCVSAVDVRAYADTTQNADGGSSWDGVTDMSVYEGENFRVTFSLTAQWESGFNANVRLDNTGTEVIDNWSLGLDYPGMLSHVWNAEITAGESGHYIIQNAGWNQDIPVGGCVEFGIGEQENFCGFPTNYELIGKLSDLSAEDYAVTYALAGDWGSGFSATISITNRTEHAIEDWILEFDFDREITELWNGVIDSHTGNHYIVRNAGYNSIIAAGSELVVGFNGIGGQAEDEPWNCILRSILAGNADLSEPGMGEDDTEEYPSDDVQYDDFVEWNSMTDTDGDGLPDEIEADYGTDPLNADTDGDGLTDGYEVLYSSTDPAVEYTYPESGVPDGKQDFDKDGLTNIEEQELGTDCHLADTDSDLLLDGEEVRVYGTDPLNADTDGDMLLDGYEMKIGLDPLNPRTFGYPDGEHPYEYAVEADSDLLAPINSGNEQYQMSFTIEGSGGALSELMVRESAYTNAVRQDYMLGCMPEILLLDDEKEDGITGVALSFRIDDSYIRDDEVEEVSGLGRYHIFKYIEELNFLCPVNTTADEESRCIKAVVDEVGTYCVVDMKLWLDSIGFEAVATAEIAGSEPDSIVRMMERKGGGINYNRDVIDIAFCINSNDYDVLYDDELQAIKAEIGKICRGIEQESRSVRFYLIDQNGNIVRNRYGMVYASSASEVEGLLWTVTTKQSVEKTINKQIDTMLGIGMRANAFKAAMFIGGGAVNDDWNHSLIHKIADANVHCLMVYPYAGVGSWCDWVVEETDGELFFDYFNFANDVLYYIYKYIPNVPNVVYHTIVSHNLSTIKLKNPLVRGGSTDTDGDTLTDWQEVDQKQVMVIKDNKVLLPTLKEYLENNSELIPWDADWSKKYRDMTDKHGERFVEMISKIYILPVISDPVSKDGDGDGILDPDDRWDGTDKRYKKLNPLHKDTIETLFPEIARNSKNNHNSATYLQVKDNDIKMTLKVKFMGDAEVRASEVLRMKGLDLYEWKEMDKVRKRVGEDCTLKDLVMHGVPERWNGTYLGTEFDFCRGMQVNFMVEMQEVREGYNYITINMRSRVCGVSNLSGVDWNANCNRVVTMYTSRCEEPMHKDCENPDCPKYASEWYTMATYEGTVAHEFGHVMGLRDMYYNAYCNHGFEPVANEEIIYDMAAGFAFPETYGIMMRHGSAVGNDIEMILYAFVENKWQYYVPYGKKQKISKAIRRMTIYRKEQKDYRWDSDIYEMEMIES